jgi:hypothetical protein
VVCNVGPLQLLAESLFTPSAKIMYIPNANSLDTPGSYGHASVNDGRGRHRSALAVAGQDPNGPALTFQEYRYAEFSSVLSFGGNRGIAFDRECAGMGASVAGVRHPEIPFAHPVYTPGDKQDSPFDWRKLDCL